MSATTAYSVPWYGWSSSLNTRYGRSLVPGVNYPAHGGTGLVSELSLYPDEGNEINPRLGVTVPDFRAS